MFAGSSKWQEHRVRSVGTPVRPFYRRTRADLRAARAMTIMLFALSCASTPPESPEQAEADAATAARVYAALEADRLHLYIGLQVRVRNGVAYISALTFDGTVRDAATEIAREVPGVTRVVNQIEVSAGSR
jgi:osmotically-inducible protein OsmY